MKKKLGIVLALMMVISLSLVPAVVSASPGIGLNAVGSGTAEISTARYHSPDNSVKLYVDNGGVDWAEVSIPVDIALKDITELKFWERIESYGSSGWHVSVILGVDCDGDGVFRADVPAWHQRGTMPNPATLLAGDSFVEMEAVSALSAPLSWTLTDALIGAGAWWTPNKTGNGLSSDIYCSFADLLTRIDAGTFDTNILSLDVKVLCVKLLIGGSGSWMDETAYVDDATINGVTYDFEPTSSVGLTTAVPDIVAISANPTSIDFGTLYPGETSAVFDITVENIGTRTVDVDASATGSTLFEDNLMLKNEPKDWTDWGVGTPWSNIVEDLVMGASDEVKTKLPVPTGYTPSGTETATLIFEATPSP